MKLRGDIANIIKHFGVYSNALFKNLGYDIKDYSRTYELYSNEISLKFTMNLPLII